VRWLDQPQLEVVPGTNLVPGDVSLLLATGRHAATRLAEHRPMVAGRV
jgi:hypothetical protein